MKLVRKFFAASALGALVAFNCAAADSKPVESFPAKCVQMSAVRPVDENAMTGCFVNELGMKLYLVKGVLDRGDGPALEDGGRREWYRNGKLHREDGPAIEFPDGGQLWYRDGKLHREDGPAVSYADGKKHWYLDGRKVTEDDVRKIGSGGQKPKRDQVPGV